MANLIDMFGSPITKWYYTDGGLFSINDNGVAESSKVIRVEKKLTEPKDGMFGIFYGHFGHVIKTDDSSLEFVVQLRWEYHTGVVHVMYSKDRFRVGSAFTQRVDEISQYTYNMMMLKYG